jgi:hypothetical protein
VAGNGEDCVLIQFGHNDKTTTALSFRSNLTSMIDQVRDRSGGPAARRRFDGNQLDDVAPHINSVSVNLAPA